MDLTSRFSDALVFAAALHARQRRKVSGAPYLAHLLNVAGIVLEYGTSEDEAIAAVLHDAIEDQGGPVARAEIRRRFGDAVTVIVDGCSDTDTIPKPPWQQRKEAHLAALKNASASVRLVTAADKLDNARSLAAALRSRGAAAWELFRGGREGTLWYYRAVLDVLSTTGVTPLLEELDRAIGEVERLAKKSPSPSGRGPG
jgi:(p)ppGpp synthase/HD superfamily hydrolase